ncbi:MAG: hypothetical protein ACRYE9_06265, partial [Janthinobacterium lividum]
MSATDTEQGTYWTQPKISFDLDSVVINSSLPRLDVSSDSANTVIFENTDLANSSMFQKPGAISLIPKGFTIPTTNETIKLKDESLPTADNFPSVKLNSDPDLSLLVSTLEQLGLGKEYLNTINFDNQIYIDKPGGEVEPDIFASEADREEWLLLNNILRSSMSDLSIISPEALDDENLIADDNIEYITDSSSGIKGEEIIVSLTINYEEQDQLYTIVRTDNNNFLISPEAIEPIQVNDEYIRDAITSFNGKRYVNITNLDKTMIKFDRTNLAAEIVFPADRMKTQIFDSAIHDNTNDYAGKEARGAFLNYDITFSRTEKTKYFSSMQDLNYFFEKGVFYSNFFTKGKILDNPVIKDKNQKKVDSHLVRLDTNWTFDSVNNLARWRVGDIITRPADWSGSSRLIGIQYATNFLVKPGFITHPLIDFAGRAELPSTLDIYTESGSLYHGQPKSGDFNIANLPITTGHGELIVKAQDVTGQIKTLIFPYYIAPSLLAKGL